MKNWMLALLTMFTTVSALSQTQITGTVIDGDLQSGLPGASVILKGTTVGTSTDIDGRFDFTVTPSSGQVEISFMGYKTKAVPFSTQTNTIDLGRIVLTVDENLLDDIVIMGVADVAKDRKTPVAVSTIKEAQIQERIGNQEFPEMLVTTPSIYSTKGGGGFGDGRVNIRGFDTNNTAVMINGVPVNDMEGGTVYWSNWAGLSDVTSFMQVQRGLGSSKLAIASVGGTINIITRAADKAEGGTATLGIANDGYFKSSLAYNTGLLQNGLSASVLFSRTAGSMYIDGSKFEGYNYYIALGYKPNEKHDIQFTFTGAPQWHHQNYSSSIADYLKYGEDGKPNRRYNPNWGYLNGEEYSTNVNYYSKPVMSLNWDWTISDQSKLSTVAYASWGRGAGTGFLGSINGNSFSRIPKTADGQYRWDDIVAWNQGKDVPDFGAPNADPNAPLNRSNGLVRRSHINSHDWYGILSSFNHKVDENLNFTLGIDGRYYYGYHMGVVNDFLGGNGYLEKGNLNIPGGYIVTDAASTKPSANPFAKAVKDKSQIASRNYDGEVTWIGAFGQVEYSKNDFSVFAQGSVSNQAFQRIDNWVVDGVTVQQGQVVNRKTGFENILGYNIKGGANYNIDEFHNVFVNAGYYSKQPNNYTVFPNYEQVVNPDLQNEKVTSFEAGYGFRGEKFRANLNLYHTIWTDRTVRIGNVSVTDNAGNAIDNAYATVLGVKQVHTGVEVEMTYDVNEYLSLNGMFSYGDWNFKNNAEGQLYDNNGDAITMEDGSNNVTLALDGVKVSDAAQTTAALGFTVKPLRNLNVYGTWRYAGRLFANISIDRNFIIKDGIIPEASKKGALELPDFNLFDLGLSYTWDFGKNQLVFTGNVYNLFDATYISDGKSSIHKVTKGEYDALIVDEGQPTEVRKGIAATYPTYEEYLERGTYKGLDTRNTVYFGFGRTWAASVSFRF